MSGIGHNRGPSIEPGGTWRTHCWTRARADLMPRLPIEVVRLRVKRAAEIGLDYKTYAGFRATTGHDIVAFLFSTNALRLLRQDQRLEAARAVKLAAAKAALALAVQPPLDPARLLADLEQQQIAINHADRAPKSTLSWGETRCALLDLMKPLRQPADRVLMIGDTGLERGWAEAARMAGYLPSERYFNPAE